jgi:hypothetical protein
MVFPACAVKHKNILSVGYKNRQGDFSMKKNKFFKGLCEANSQAKSRRLLAVVALLLAFGLLLAGCSKKDSDGSGGNEVKETDFIYAIDESGDGIEIRQYTGKATVVVIPSEIEGFPVSTIGESSFIWNKKVVSVTIPGSVTKIFREAFSGLSSLTSVTIPEGVTEIGYSAFSGCSSLTSVTIPEGVTEIGYLAFKGCSSLASVTISEGVTKIGEMAFEGCSSLASVTIPGSVTEIGYSAFKGCSGLASVTISEGVTEIGHLAFEGCSSLASVTIPGSVTEIGRAFEGCSSLASVIIEEGVTEIGGWAFEGLSSLTSVTIPGSVTQIGEEAFEGCSSLASVTIEEGVTTIGKRAFSGCSSLASVAIPGSVREIGSNAFYKCDSLTSVSIEEGAKISFGGNDDNAVVNGHVFLDTALNIQTQSALRKAGYRGWVPGKPAGDFMVTTNKAGDGVIIAKYTGAAAEAVIPSELEGFPVREIGKEAFKDASSLTSVAIPDSVLEIGDYVFKNCSGLVTITISPIARKWGHSSLSDGPIKLSLASQAALRKAGYK